MYPYAVHGGFEWVKLEVSGVAGAISSNSWREG